MNDLFELLHDKVKRLQAELGEVEKELLKVALQRRDKRRKSRTQSGTGEVVRSHMYHFAGHLNRALLHLPKAIRDEVDRADNSEPKVPERLARALMLSRARLDDAVSLAIRQYLDARADRAKLDGYTESIPSDISKDLLARAKRQIDNQVKNLEELGVEIRDICVGTQVDPSLHEVVQTESTGYDDDADTIVRAETPAFVWRDEFGQEQIVPARVVVFTEASNSQSRRQSECEETTATETDDGLEEADANEAKTSVTTSAA